MSKKDINNAFSAPILAGAENYLQSAFQSTMVSGTSLKWAPDRNMFVRQTDSKKITKIINSLKSNALTGYDNIKVKLIQKLKAVLAPTIYCKNYKQ